MISLLPYKQIVFESQLNGAEARRRLALEVAKRNWGLQWFERRTEKFEGTVSETDFQISRIIHYRNSFLPMITGRFIPLSQGVRIEVKMKLHVGVLLFTLVWLGIVGFLVATGSAQVMAMGKVEILTAVPLLVMLLFLLTVTIMFKLEANKASKLLREIFVAQEIAA